MLYVAIIRAAVSVASRGGAGLSLVGKSVAMATHTYNDLIQCSHILFY